MEEEEEVAAVGQEWQGVAQKRKAWAKSRDSWQASEAERPSPEAPEQEVAPGKLPLAAEGGNIPNEKIAIWLKDCRTPLGASLDEQSNPTLRGMLMKNGGSFEDDLSLGAEANQLHQSSEQMEICNGMLAKDKRLQFHQKGRSMNSTGSGKSSATVSSVSELLELYEEDPEEVLYNLGFGRDEPDIASKIPSRFFNSSSFARGIDIKVFLNAQLQRMEVENPNFALTSRFRQIEVLTTVANAFSSLYSQVSGTPLQKIGSMNSTASNKEASSPPPLTRSNTASRLMKTLSKLNLCGNPQTGEGGNPTTPSPIDLRKIENGSEESEVKNEPKTPKHFKASLLATVKEEVPSNQPITEGAHKPSELFVSTNVEQETQDNAAPHEDGHSADSLGHSEKSADINSSGLESEVLESTRCGPEGSSKLHVSSASTVDKEPCVPIANPSIVNLMLQQKDSFEMEEIQSTEGEIPHTPNTGQLALTKTKKDQLLRSASQHSDSSGFAEDSSTDCFLLNQPQGHESLQAMGSSADSCDSETTVTSYSEELKTPVAEQELYFNELEEENFLLSEVEQRKREMVSEVNAGQSQKMLECATESGGSAEFGSEDFVRRNEESSAWEAEADVLEEGSEDSDADKSSEHEFPPYKTHHILKSMSSIESSSSSPSSAERVSIALQRAQRRISASSDSRAGRSLLKSKDLLLKQRHRIADLGYPLRRSQSLPTTLLNPVRVVSSVNVQLAPGRQTLCGPPSFTYKYDTPEESETKEKEEERHISEANSSSPRCTSTLFIAPSTQRRDPSHPSANKVVEEPCRSRIQSCPLHLPTPMTQSSCSLHSLHSDCLDRPLCAHMRTFSTHSIPSTPGSSCSGLPSPFGCPHSLRHFGHPYQLSTMNSPSTVEMQLRRVLHDIRSSLQNLSQNAVMRGHDVTATSYSTQRSSILPLYENTFQDLQGVRRNLNLFRTQMMDLELAMLRQQTTVYQHMTEEERYEADQLQSLRKSVRMELQELEMQLEERLLALEDQLRSMHVSSPFRQQTLMGMYGGRSAENLSCPSPVNVIEPVSELIREQSYLKSELGMGLGEPGMETPPAEGSEAAFDHGGNSDSSSVCSSQASRKAVAHSSETTKPKPHGKRVYRACVALMPSPPARAGTGQPPEHSEQQPVSMREAEQKLEKTPLAPTTEEIHRSVENDELQQVIREIKESIVGEIRREIVSGLLAAVSSPSRSANTKQEMQP
ncbi:protein ITPRID2 isoform X2 [Sceloporus undulatus]|uniref:protein ITPRID2 isoform X2 n=1 Tax=Sceloporus undulatus TaxID=8520 RepID=UPI001C4A84E9|nr:protein ITPRID2 isoform X2 [Sceloporus undulatus]